jgi:hypothetical protein
MGILKELIVGKIENSIKDILQNTEKEISRGIAIKMRRFKRNLIKEMIGIFILLVALIFLALAVLYLLVEFAGLNKTMSFAVIGIILLVIALLFRIR